MCFQKEEFLKKKSSSWEKLPSVFPRRLTGNILKKQNMSNPKAEISCYNGSTVSPKKKQLCLRIYSGWSLEIIKFFSVTVREIKHIN